MARQTFQFVLLIVLLAPIVQAAPPGFVRWSASDLDARDTALATRMGRDHSARETLADYETPRRSHRFRFIRRDADGVPEQHTHIEDVVLIQSGRATLVVGGELVAPVGTDGEYRGDDISGGVPYPVGAGDLLHIPADTPHRYLVPDGGHVTYLLVRLPALVGEGSVPDDAPDLPLEPPGFALWTASELAERHVALSMRVGPDHSARETLADFGSPTRSHRFRFIHRNADGVPEIHDNIIDLVIVKSGAATLLVGGEMLDRQGSLGSGIAGGSHYPVATGDVLHIPVATPHGYLVPEGGHITYLLVRLPAAIADGL